MPWMTIPIALAIGSLAATGVGVGEQLANQPGSPKAPAAPAAPTPAQQTATRAQTEAAQSQQDPSLIAETGGTANPGYLAQQSALLTGTAGQPGALNSALQAANSQFGINPAVARAFGFPVGSPPTGPVSGTSAGTSAFMPAGVGNSNPSQQPTSSTALSEFVNSFFRS